MGNKSSGDRRQELLLEMEARQQGKESRQRRNEGDRHGGAEKIIRFK